MAPSAAATLITTAVVAADTGGLGELVDDGTTGRLVPPGDVEALAAVVAALWADPDEAAAMGRAGRAAVERFMPAQVAPQVEAVYEAACSSVGAAP